MPKFHDEFFRKGSPEEDKLVLRCLTPAGKLAIAKAVESAIGEELVPPQNGAAYGKRKVAVCDSKNTPHCKEGKPTMVAHHGEFGERGLVCAVSSPYSTAWEVKCEYFDKTTPYTKVSAKLLPHGQETVDALLFVRESEFKIDHETEVLCRNNGFIVGYADLVLRLSGLLKLSAKIKDDWTWKDFDTVPLGETKIVVEVKPEIKQCLQVLRQLKTYMEMLRIHRGAIATYSALDKDTIELLKHEKIAVVKFDEFPHVNETELEPEP